MWSDSILFLLVCKVHQNLDYRPFESQSIVIEKAQSEMELSLTFLMLCDLEVPDAVLVFECLWLTIFFSLCNYPVPLKREILAGRSRNSSRRGSLSCSSSTSGLGVSAFKVPLLKGRFLFFKQTKITSNVLLGVGITAERTLWNRFKPLSWVVFVHLRIISLLCTSE